jgi:hypothetical protein
LNALIRDHIRKKIDEIKWLNMAPKPDKDLKKRGDIVLLYEIIKNSVYWQDK